MRVLRANRDSLMAVLEAFVFDPLVSWQFIDDSEMGTASAKTPSKKKAGRTSRAGAKNGDQTTRWNMASNADVNMGDAAIVGSKPNAKPTRHVEDEFEFAEGRGWQAGNPKGRAIVKRIHDKLTGTDFNPNEELTVPQQVNKLIQQATSSENLAVLYAGWVSLW
ncbi:hypothetical protein GGF46_005501 [Coemansia sp. RSA 552]|nr:hypothetical protein GGF46_005501 [Coemansia sp. RSA 552]